MNIKPKERKNSNRNLFIALTTATILFYGNNQVIASSSPIGELAIELTELAQSTTKVQGTVVDTKGEPIIGASILEKGTPSNGIMTDADGKFLLDVKPGATLIVSYVGYKKAEVKATRLMRIELAEDSEIIDEVIVVGYGTQKKANLTGAVSTIDVSKVLEARPQSDVVKGLQGVVPGLTILNKNGKINSSPEIRIRGVGTLSNDAASNPLIIVDGVPMSDISYLNTQDIQDISVLKDAASTSIYGARAAFGVIMVTTKAAKKVDRVSINYTNNFSWETPTVLPDFPDVPTQLRSLINANNRMGKASELFGMYLDQMVDKAVAWQERHGGKAGYRDMVLGDDFEMDKNGKGMYYADWDVVNIMYRKWKPAQSHNVSLQGTSGKTSYFMSLGYNKNEGVLNFNPDEMKKYTATMNITNDVTDWLQIGGRFSYSNKDFTTPYVYRNPYEYMWRWGSFFPYGTYQGINFRTEPGYLSQTNDTKQADSYTRIGAFLKATIIKGLTFNADYTYNIRHFNEKQVGGPVSLWDSWGTIDFEKGTSVVTGSGANEVDMTSRRDKSYAFNAYADYTFTAFNNHNFKVMAGVNVEEGDNYSHYSKRTGLLDKENGEFNLATGDMSVSGWHNQWGVAGFFGRINYDWAGKWILELNGRYDGSSKFPSNSRWAFFPSGSIGYRISEEAFMQPLKPVVSNAKIRGSFGEIGNQEVGANMFIATMGSDKVNWIVNGAKAMIYNMPKLVSSTLRWERIQTTNIGLDLGFMDNELNVNFDWFQRNTLDMLAPGKVMPDVLGASSPMMNAGSLRSRGWEINLDWHHQFGDVSVYANANLSDYVTKVTKWDNDAKLLNQNYTGKTVGDIWGFETDRLITYDDCIKSTINGKEVWVLDPAKHASQSLLEGSGTFHYGPGDILFKNLDNDDKISGGKGSADDHGDLKVIGNTTPRYQYSFRLGAAWKGFDLDLYFQGVGKRDIWTQSAFVMPLMRGVDAIYANQTDYWTEENLNYNAKFPRLWGTNAGKGSISTIENGQNNFYPQTRYLQHMAYLRLKNATVGYTIPSNLTKKAYIQKARIYFSAENLFELINRSGSPIDPEINDGEGSFGNGTWGRIDPMFRAVSFGIQVTF